MLSDPVLAVLRRELRRVAPGIKITTDDVRDEIVGAVIKRNVIESDEIKDATRRIKRSQTRRKRSRSEGPDDATSPPAPADNEQA